MLSLAILTGTPTVPLLLRLLLWWPVVMARPDVSTVSSISTGRPAVVVEPCVNATSGETGRCMFAMDCFRASGRHIGICTKGYFFGSCCALPNGPQDLPRVPIVNNAIDGPISGPLLPAALEWNVWSSLLADIYGIRPPPVEAPYPPPSSFHAPTAAVVSTVHPTSLSATSSPTIETSPVMNTTTPAGSSTTPTPTPTTSPTPASTPTTGAATLSTTKAPVNVLPINVTVIYANASSVESLASSSSVENWEQEMDAEDFTTTASTLTTTTTTAATTTAAAPTTTEATTTRPKTASTSTPTSTTIKATTKVNVSQPLIVDLIPAGKPLDAPVKDHSLDAVCGKPMYRWPKIVSGENARHGQWPWQVSLQEKSRRGYFHKCGAALINREWAVTAAHCLQNVSPDNLLVRLGGIDFASYEDRFVESKVVPVQHSNFNVLTQQNDIALLKLVTPVEYASNILPICLPDAGMNFDGDMSFVAGWGRLGERAPTATVLQYVGVPIVNNTECEKAYKSINKYIDRRSICAGYPMGLKDSCEGDSGGPMMVYKKGRWVLAGIISWGVGCARPNQPGVSTRATEFLDWIHSHVSISADSSVYGAFSNPDDQI